MKNDFLQEMGAHAERLKYVVIRHRDGSVTIKPRTEKQGSSKKEK